MRRLRLAAIVLGSLVVLAAIVLGLLYWRATRTPEFLERTVRLTPEEARDVVARLTSAPQVPPTNGATSARPRPQPYRLVLGDRELTALVMTHAPPAITQSVADPRVHVRETDIVVAGQLRTSPLEGSIVWVDVRPSAGANGALCFAFGRLHIGNAEVPEALVRELAGREPPRATCAPHAGRLPGPLTRVTISGGRVVLEGTTR